MMKTRPEPLIPLRRRNTSYEVIDCQDCNCDCACDLIELIPHGHVGRLQGREAVHDPTSWPNDLVQAPFHRDAGTKMESALSVLSAWLHITDRCNLTCAYCYLPHKRLDMSIEVGKAVIDTVFRSAAIHHYSRVKLKYAGGEPLIRFDTVTALQRYALQTARETDIALSSIVLSNGTLLSAEHLATMQELDLRLMISMDGLGQANDRQRFYANGKGTYEDVKRGVESALNFGVAPVISVTVTGRNASSIADLVSWLLDHGLPFGLNFYRESDLSQSLSDLKYEEQQIVEGMLAAYRVIERNPPQYSLLACLVDRANLTQEHLYTCGVGNDYLVFDWQGRVSKCQMSLSQSISDIYAFDPLLAIRTDRTGLQNLSVEEKEGCRECEWKYWCAGGCPLLTYRATGRYDVKSPNCDIYRALYPEVLRLESIRRFRYRQAS